MSNWSQKKLLMTICGGAGVLCAAAAGGVYYTQGLIDEVAAQIATQEQAVAAADAKIAKIPNLEKDVIILRENLDEYVKILPDNKELTEFTRTLNKFERQTGILSTGLTNKNVRPGKTKGNFTPIEFTYDMTATLWQALKFINLIENYERFVSITDFSIVPGGQRGGEQQRDGDAVHTVKLTMQTYTYNKAGGAKEVTIPHYADRKEELREEIWNRMQAIRIDRYEHKGVQGRRDILVDPRERGGDLRLDGLSQADQRAILDKYVDELKQLAEMLKHIRSGEATMFEQYTLDKRFRAELATMLAGIEGDGARLSYGPVKLRWANEVIGPLDQLQQQLDNQPVDEQRQDPYLPAADLAQLVSDLESDCNGGMLEQARERFEAVAERVQVPTGDERYDLAVQARSWMVKATTALDFKGLDLRLQGVIVNEIGRSGVLLNGEVFEEGDFVSDELLVKAVEEEQVWFVFRGLTLVRTM
ncbi:MAG: type 4a pilus biogenesis protein PilO [Planctomycetes bacterium]|nr:type 4a pilus biogenesis protein PilO [Planctomycetota bacterium]